MRLRFLFTDLNKKKLNSLINLKIFQSMNLKLIEIF